MQVLVLRATVNVVRWYFIISSCDQTKLWPKFKINEWITETNSLRLRSRHCESEPECDTADKMMLLLIWWMGMFYGCLHSGVQSDVLRWRLNTSAPLKRQIGDELELNDDLTVILAGSCGTSLQKRDMKGRQSRLAPTSKSRWVDEAELFFWSLRSENKKEQLGILLNRSGFLPKWEPTLLLPVSSSTLEI